MSDTHQNETIALFFKNNTSDKEYHVHLKASGTQWLVEIKYGKRGSSLRSALKTALPVDYALAKATYNKIVSDQLKQGYTPSSSGQAYQDTPREKNFTGVLPQLLNPIGEESFSQCIASDEWMFEEKFDGQRLLLRKSPDGVVGINRDGLIVSVPTSFETLLHTLPCQDCIIDGEWLGERFAPFDLLEINGVSIRLEGAKQRKLKLDELLSTVDHNIFLHVIAAYDTASKQTMHDHIKLADGEGVVAKKVNAPYSVGRPHSGGDQLKRKFVESATVLMTGQHATKRSISFSVFDAHGLLVCIGNTNVPPNHNMPVLNDIVEVQYLYASQGSSLYQPVYKGPRVDKSSADCVLSQLKYKSEGPATAPKKLKVKI